MVQLNKTYIYIYIYIYIYRTNAGATNLNWIERWLWDKRIQLRPIPMLAVFPPGFGIIYNYPSVEGCFHRTGSYDPSNSGLWNRTPVYLEQIRRFRRRAAEDTTGPCWAGRARSNSGAIEALDRSRSVSAAMPRPSSTGPRWRAPGQPSRTGFPTEVAAAGAAMVDAEMASAMVDICSPANFDRLPRASKWNRK